MAIFEGYIRSYPLFISMMEGRVLCNKDTFNPFTVKFMFKSQGLSGKVCKTGKLRPRGLAIGQTAVSLMEEVETKLQTCLVTCGDMVSDKKLEMSQSKHVW